MKAKRFILMLLVALMSVTGVCAQTLNSIPFSIYSTSDKFKIEDNGNWFFSGTLPGWIILKATKKYKLTEIYVPDRPADILPTHDPSIIDIYGSNDATNWESLGIWDLTLGRQFRIDPGSSSVAYQYFKLVPKYNKDYYYEVRPITLYTTDNVIEGYGTEEDPYLIKKPADFITLKECQADFGSFYAKVNNDIDFSTVGSWQSVDFSATPFVLDGNGKEIRNLNGANGLFSKVNGATIKNLGLKNCTINGTQANCGALASTAEKTVFINCYAIGSITSSHASANCGGLVGMASGNTQLTQCYSVTDKDNDGGQHLPLCGASDGSCTATLCYHYGSTSSALSTSVEKADIASGRLAYLLNNGNITGPYYQLIGTDAYPHFTKTESNYVYLSYDGEYYTNVCSHRDCTIYLYKAPSCLGSEGNVEYGKCHNSICDMYFPTSDRNAVTTNTKNFVRSNKFVNIQDRPMGNCGFWRYSESKSKDDTPYYNVMELSLERHSLFGGDYEISYTVVDDEPTMNLHLFFSASMTAGTFSVRFYVNGTERTTLRKDYPSSISEQHEIITVDGLQKFDYITVVFNYRFTRSNISAEKANLFIGTEKELPASHSNLQKHGFNYNCIDGGHLEYYECDKCTSVFTQNTPQNDDNLTTMSALALAPVGAHNFSTVQVEGNLYGNQCQNEHCTTYDSDKFVLRNYHDNTDLPLTYDGNTYTTSSAVSLTDGKAYVSPVAFDTPSLSYSRYYPENVWSAWFTPFDVNASYLLDNGLTPAYIEGIHNYDDDEDGTIDRTVMEIVKISKGRVLAGTPLLVRAVEGYSSQLVLSDVTMKANDVLNNIHTETASTKFDFIGTYTGTTAAAADKIYSLNNSGAMVHRTGKILPLRWYCQIEQKPSFIGEETSPALARAIYIRVIGEEDQVTGIRTLYNEADQTLERADGIFDLSGRKLSAPQRGMINIINGKKQFVR